MPFQRLLFVTTLLLLPLWSFAETDRAPQRERFSQALDALEAGRIDRFEQLAAGLEAYPLYPYLRYEYLRRHLRDRASQAEVKAFIQRWADTPLADRLRVAWLGELASRGEWDGYLELYRADGSAERACLAARAQWDGGERDEALAAAERLWLVGVSQPKACDPLFERWMERGGATPAQARERIRLAMDAGQLGLTRYLERFVPEAEREWVQRWRRLYRQPATELQRLQPDGEWSALLFTTGVRRLIREDADAADRLWRQRHETFPLTPKQRADTARLVALGLAWHHRPAAQARLRELPPAWHNGESRAWRVRSALWELDWPAVLEAIAQLEGNKQERPEWRYWRARALAALGRWEEADVLYRALASDRSYYGFLAAEQAGEPPRIETVPLEVAPERREALAARPAMQRIGELLAVSRELDARREWWRATRHMAADELATAAGLAERWGWHDQAIFAVGRGRFFDDLELRFPTPYEDRVSAEAGQRELDVAFIYAVMRQESAFFAQARSGVGALGLMQLMPSTARLTARRLRQPEPGVWDILEPDNNIRLGAAHLRHLLDEYAGNRLYTMAAYNAGPGRVKRWLPESGRLPGDVWVACLPFDETREYVKRIYAYTLIYEWRLGKEPTPVSVHLPAIGPGGPQEEVVEAQQSEGGRSDA